MDKETVKIALFFDWYVNLVVLLVHIYNDTFSANHSFLDLLTFCLFLLTYSISIHYFYDIMTSIIFFIIKSMG